MLKAWFPVAFFAFPVATQSVHGTVFFFLRCHRREEKITVRKRENVKDPKELISEAPSGRQLPQ
jgi:hypothetical protein